MTKLVTYFVALTFSGLTSAAADNVALARKLYPSAQEDQVFVAKFFEIADLHKTNDPLLGQRGPGVTGYRLSQLRFAFMTNDLGQTVDLVFFNWDLPVFEGLRKHAGFSALYGTPVYVLKAVPKKSIASQGEKHDELTNFSYVQGAHHMAAGMLIDNPSLVIPDKFLDWKPHSDYMDANHPLRKTLGNNVLSLLSPKKNLFMSQAGLTDRQLAMFEAMLAPKGGFQNVIMGMMVHEMYHVKNNEDVANRLSSRRKIDEDRKALVAELTADATLRNLYALYAKIVFSIGDSMKNARPDAGEAVKLADLNRVIFELKSKHANAWAYLWNYEYTEGFAEYVSAYSMIQAGVTTLAQKIDLEKADENNFAYRTGAIGGLFLSHRLKQMPFAHNEDHAQSAWEIIANKTRVQPSDISVAELNKKYADSSFKEESEIKLVIEYLVSTVLE